MRPCGSGRPKWEAKVGGQSGRPKWEAEVGGRSGRPNSASHGLTDRTLTLSKADRLIRCAINPLFLVYNHFLFIKKKQTCMLKLFLRIPEKSIKFNLIAIVVQ